MTKAQLRILVFVAHLGFGFAFSGSAYGVEPIASRWNGTTGNWSAASRWIPAGTVPNNTPSTEYSVTINSGTVTTDIPVTVTAVTMNGGQLQLNQPLRAGELTLNRGDILGPAGLTVDGDLIFRSGLINNVAEGPAGFAVGGRVIKQGYGPATLAPFGRDGDYEILIEQGKFRYHNGGLGSSLGNVVIVSPEFARIETFDSTGLTDDVYINNARGFAGTGAMVSNRSRSGVSGDVFLGDVGGVIGLIPGGLTDGVISFYGDIHGGALEIVGRGIIDIESPGNDYAGRTMVGASGEQVLFRLRGPGRLLATSALEVGARATLRLDNENQLIDDRLPDTAQVVLRGGTIELLSSSTLSSTERLADLQLAQGASTLSTGGWRSNLLFSRLDREGAATVDFQRRSDTTADGPRIAFDETPALVNGILGGWATVNAEDFAAYDSDLGVVALGNRLSRPAQINSAGPDDHVRLTGLAAELEPLAADRSIATLAITVEGTRNVDLGGHTLTLRDGGFIRSGGSNVNTLVHNGQLTAGNGPAHANLYLHTRWQPVSPRPEGVRISASIVDNPEGGAVSLVKSGNFEVTLLGMNSYSGPTAIQEGALVFQTEGALPNGGELIVDGGSARLEYLPSVEKQLARLDLKQGGFIFAPKQGTTNHSEVQIDADTYGFESGSVSISLAGDGTLRKRTDGVVELTYDSPNFIGSIIVEQGVLIAGSRSVSTVPRALGNGETTIRSGGTLVHSAVATAATFMQLAARLNLAGGDVGLAPPVRTTRWDFNGEWRITADSRLLLFDPRGIDEITTPQGVPATPTVNLLRSVVISDGAGMTVLGPGVVQFNGGLVLTGDVILDAPESSINLNTIAATTDASTLHLRGNGAFQIPRMLTANPGAEFTIEIGPGVQAAPVAGTFILDDGVTLEVNGRLTHTERLTMFGGRVAGVGMLGNIVNHEGELSPGNSVGALTVGDYHQGAGAVLTIELLGGPNHASDQLRARLANLSGAVIASLAPGADIAPGDVFHILIADQISTTDLVLQPNGFAGRLDVVTLTSGSDSGKQALRLSVVPEPASGVIAAFVIVLLALNARGNPICPTQHALTRAGKPQEMAGANERKSRHNRQNAATRI